MILPFTRTAVLYLIVSAQAIAAPTLEETQRFVAMRQIPYSIPLTFDSALQASLVSIESTALKQFRLGAKGWSWQHPNFQQSYGEATKAVSALLEDEWNRCTFPVLKANNDSYDSLAYAYKSPMTRLTDVEFDELRSFYSSEVGARYRSYLAYARKAFMEMDIARQKRELGFPEFQVRKMSVDPNSAEIGFLRATHRRLGIAPNYRDYHISIAIDLSSLPAVHQRLSGLLSNSDREAIEQFLTSSAAKKEEDLIRTWQTSLAMKLYLADKQCQTEVKLQALSSTWKP